MIALHADLLGERARLTPEKTVLVFVPTGERLTYRQLDERAARMARFLSDPLRGPGLAKGERAGLLANNSVEFLETFFGAIKAGVVVVPLGTRLTPPELAHVVRDSGMTALLYGPEHAGTVRALEEEASVPRRVLLAPGERAGGQDLSWTEAAALYDAAGFARTPCGPEDLCALLYTSGTTGKPKGVMVPHRMVAWNAIGTALGWQLREEDVSPIFTPLYHAGGLGAFLMPVLAIGGTVVLHAGFDAAEIWRTVASERCTVVLGVPTIWKLLSEAPAFASADLSSVRWLISGGAPLPLFVIETYHRRGVAFKQGYGLTEVGVNCFAMTVAESEVKKGSIGKPLMWTEARLVDEAGEEVPGGEVGELCLRGPHVCLGYWRNPEATRAALDADGWFHTGDLARRDADGFYTIAGRRKDMLISGGVNVYPAEIEGELLLCPGVADAAVVGVPHETWGESGVAFVVRQEGEPGESLSAVSLTEFLEARLARYKVPREFLFVEALPRTAYGKVVKGELRERWTALRGGRSSGGVILAHETRGSGEPVLLLNGGMMSWGAWDAISAPLAERFRVVLCDLRGQLRTGGPVPARLEEHADDVDRLLGHLGIPAVHVLGTSFGAEVGLLLAALHPERVLTVTAVAATDLFTEAMYLVGAPVVEACLRVPAGGDRGLVFDAIAAYAYSGRWLEANREALALRRAAVSLLPDGWFAAVAALVGSLRGADLTPHLGAIRCPVHVVAAEEDGAMPVERTLALAAKVPGARHTLVPGAGHAVVAEDPGLVVRLFLTDRDAAAPRSSSRASGIEQ